HNNHGETRINYTIDYEDLFMTEEQDYITDYVTDSEDLVMTDYATDSEYEESAKSTYKRNEKRRAELPEFDQMENVNELHRSYATLPYEIQQGTISPLTLLKKGGRIWHLLTLKELKIWIAIVIYMGVHKIYHIDDLWNSDEQKAIH
ncbi:18258_t:CDS:2, partial [Gigaspora rosea]